MNNNLLVNDKHISARIPAEVLEEFDRAIECDGLKRGEAIRRLVRDFIAQENGSRHKDDVLRHQQAHRCLYGEHWV